MNKTFSDKPTATEVPTSGAVESPQPKETFPKRSQRPGETGLANETRPGLGTRADESVDPAVTPKRPTATTKASTPTKGIRPPQPPEQRPEFREQDPNSLAHQEERDTGVSGHSSSS